MAFVDEIQFHAKAGAGGDGVVRWRHERAKEFAGAAGGNGGRGGDVYVRAVRDINVLARHKAVKEFAAGHGDAGQNWSRQGKTGDDRYIDLPIGSIITNHASGRVVELVEDAQISKILHGGHGGLGNEYFKASTNVTPMQSTPGVVGEEADFTVEINLIADAGLIGLPNAGKSSLLNSLTNARAKVGSYAFTTLDPNLGAIHGYILADIPGLIEGASEGKGLGHKFLKHVKRTKILLHLISLENSIAPESSDSSYITSATADGGVSSTFANSKTKKKTAESKGGRAGTMATKKESAKKAPVKTEKQVLSEMENTYLTIRKELEKYGNGLTEKKEIIVLTKTDLVDNSTLKKARALMKKYSPKIMDVTILDDESVKKLSDSLTKLIA